MKTALPLLLAAFIALPAAAQATAIPPEIGTKFYGRCVTQKDPRLLPGSQEVWCQCVAKNMVKNMTQEDLRGLDRQDRAATNKMLTGAYVPCLEVPVHDDTYNFFIQKNIPKATSECIATGMAKYTQTEAARLIGGVLAQYPNAFDPLAAIKQTPEFEAQQKRIVEQCGQASGY